MLHPPVESAAADFSGGEATIVPRLHRLGFEIARIGEDWSGAEVQATVASYFEMLRFEAAQQRHTKTEFNRPVAQKTARAQQGLGRAEVPEHQRRPAWPGAAVHLQLQAPRAKAQLLLRQAVQQFVLDHPNVLGQVVDAMEDVKAPGEASFRASVVAPIETVLQVKKDLPKARLARKVDWAQREEASRQLGRAGEQWVIGFEQLRLSEAGYPELLQATGLDFRSAEVSAAELPRDAVQRTRRRRFSDVRHELRKIIYTHVPEEARLGFTSMDDLLDFRVAEIDSAREQIIKEISKVNAEVLQTERRLTPEFKQSLREQLDAKVAELNSLEASKSTPVEGPVASDAARGESKTATEKIQALEDEFKKLRDEEKQLRDRKAAEAKRQAVASLIAQAIANHKKAHDQFVVELTPMLAEAGVRAHAT